MSKKKRNVLTGVEIGTSTIKVVMGELLPDDIISVLGAGEVPSLRVVKGEVADANVVQEQLERALVMAEQASGVEIEALFLAITGNHIHTVNSLGSTMVRTPNHKITEDDIVSAARNAHAYSLPPDQKVLHYFDRVYRIDGLRELANPLGQVGSKLEVDVHIIYGQHNRIETNCSLLADIMGYPATDIAFSAVAAGMAACPQEEVDKGVLLIDIGAGVTEYVVFHGPGCFHSGQVTVGCDHIANDLSLGLRLPMPKCRKILHDLGMLSGSAAMTPDGRNRLMAVESLGQPTRHIPMSTIEQVIEMRLQELMEAIRTDLEANRALDRVASGIRLCGGGARIAGIDRLVEHVFRMPVTIARPRLASGKPEILEDPRFLVPIGLLRWGRLSLNIGTETQPPLWHWHQLRQDARKAWKAVTEAVKW
ncbi:MAG: cell division protein FtsA [Lentisphaerae bacterium RIFOXYB12_FULL_65_16]|nr:MAG: cell division protein FtsA [Lentisphaerae bacterium RIFOXYA12_64_32]OGV93456.1 MAG: cell division protein FtsA [Lentisphaerae bacterium RIFOXYB12_FULL_65_16]